MREHAPGSASTSSRKGGKWRSYRSRPSWSPICLAPTGIPRPGQPRGDSRSTPRVHCSRVSGTLSSVRHSARAPTTRARRVPSDVCPTAGCWGRGRGGGAGGGRRAGLRQQARAPERGWRILHASSPAPRAPRLSPTSPACAVSCLRSFLVPWIRDGSAARCASRIC